MHQQRKYEIKNTNPIQEYRIGETVIFIKDQFVGNVEPKKAVDFFKSIPASIRSNIHAIYVGDFFHLRKRQVDAIYDHGIIYISNVQSSTEDFIKNLVHEIAHACEVEFYDQIYNDGNLKKEFLNKRNRMYEVLKAYDLNELPVESYLNVEYNNDFDKFLYKTIGYNKLHSLVDGIFISPYAATSLREYFANGFENFFIKNNKQLQRVSPALFEKISLFA